jgi:AmpE protein
MKLLAILMSLCIERLINPGLFLHRFNWFSAYLRYLQHKLAKPFIWSNFLGIFIVILPLLALVAIAYYGLGNFTNDMVKELIAIIILVYCLGPGDTRRQIEGFIAAANENDTERADHYFNTLASGHLIRERAISEYATISFNQEIFAVLFWFILLGPLGSLLYRLSVLMEQASQTDIAQYSHAKLLRGLLDWLPIRFLGLSFTLVGNFTDSFQFIRHKILTGYTYNQTFLYTIGLIAVGADPHNSATATLAENQAILALFDRTLIIWLVAIALFTLGTWLY